MKKLLIAIGLALAASAAQASTYIPVLMSTATNPAVQAGTAGYSFHLSSGTVDKLTASTVTANSATIQSAITSTMTINGNLIQATAGSRTYTLPDAGANASILESTGAQTMSNKTLDNATLGSDLNANSKLISNLAAASANGQAVRWEQILGFRVLQIVSASTTTKTTSTSATYADATNLAVTITPTKASSTIWIISSVNGIAGNTANNRCSLGLRIVRAAATVIQTFTSAVAGGGASAVANNTWAQVLLFATDSPATTSATTYKIQMNNDAAGTSAVNDNTNATVTSWIWAIEIG